MARARLIKPAFFGDVTLTEVSRDARLLYAGLWQLMDRRGLMEYHPKLVKRDLFPYDDDATAVAIDGWVKDLARIGRLRIVPFGGKRYLHCPHLEKHQQFHCREHPNHLIPDAVLTATEESHGPAPAGPGASTVPVPCEHGASTTEAEAVTEAETETEAEADPNARTRETGPPPPPPLPKDGVEDLDLGDFLDEFESETWRVWVKAHTLALLRVELPKCRAKWLTDHYRRSKGGKGHYILDWMANAKRSGGSTVKRGAAVPEDFAAYLEAGGRT